MYDTFFLDVGLYPDNQPYINWPVGANRPGVSEAILTVIPTTPMQFHAAMMFAETYKEATGNEVTLVIPNFPGARQDRRNFDGDVLFSAKYYAKIVNSVGFKAVHVLDPHSDVVPALVDRCVVHNVGMILQYAGLYGNSGFFGDYDAVVAPDAGAAKRAGVMAKQLGVPVVQAWKKRDTATGKLSGFGMEDVTFAHILVVDDMCDGGGTFLGLADVLHSNGHTADLYVTHGLFTQGTEKLREQYENIITTNSTTSEKLGCKVIDILDWRLYA
jgi:ribose-phosphate pyrophosphokinase